MLADVLVEFSLCLSLTEVWIYIRINRLIFYLKPYLYPLLMDSSHIKPYGHSTMILIGFIVQVLGVFIYLITIGASFFIDNYWVDFGPVYKILFLIGNPIIIIFSFLILFQLKNKKVEGISLIKKIFPFAIFLGTLSVIEGLVLPSPMQLGEILTMILNIVVLIYWNNPSHVKYLRSIKE